VKQLIVALFIFGVGFAVIFFGALSLAMPLSGSGPVPDSVLQREILQAHVFRVLGLISPYRGSDSATAAACGAGVWALLCSLAATAIWSKLRQRKAKNA
jgi:hypothetical protein